METVSDAFASQSASSGATHAVPVVPTMQDQLGDDQVATAGDPRTSSHRRGSARKPGRPKGSWKPKPPCPVANPQTKIRAPRADKGKRRVLKGLRAEVDQAVADSVEKQTRERFSALQASGCHRVGPLIPPPDGVKETLPPEIRRLIVQLNAERHGPTAVARYVKQATGFDITPQATEYYDPTKRGSEGLAAEWRELFYETRQRYEAEIGNINLSSKAFRLTKLNEMLEEVTNQEQVDHPLAMKLIEQGAKESGDFWSKVPPQSGVKSVLLAQPVHSPETVLSLKPLDFQERFLNWVKRQPREVGMAHVFNFRNAVREGPAAVSNYWAQMALQLAQEPAPAPNDPTYETQKEDSSMAPHEKMAQFLQRLQNVFLPQAEAGQLDYRVLDPFPDVVLQHVLPDAVLERVAPEELERRLKKRRQEASTNADGPKSAGGNAEDGNAEESGQIAMNTATHSREEAEE